MQLVEGLEGNLFIGEYDPCYLVSAKKYEQIPQTSC